MSDEHQPPWRWHKPKYSQPELEDARGMRIMEASNADGEAQISIDDPVARELIRLAPEMETLLRSAVRPRDEDDERGHNVCFACEATIVRGDLPEHFDDCPVVAVLAAIDTSRKD